MKTKGVSSYEVLKVHFSQMVLKSSKCYRTINRHGKILSFDHITGPIYLLLCFSLVTTLGISNVGQEET